MKPLNLKHLLKTLCLSAVLLIGSAYYANAQTNKPDDKPGVAKPAVSYIDVFFKKYKTNTDSAIDYLFSTNALFATNSYQITVLKQKLDSLRLTIGNYLGKELIIQKSASPSLVLYSYLVKHQNEPVRFTFMFYKPQNDWVLYRFNYDDQMDIELIEAAKIDNKR